MEIKKFKNEAERKKILDRIQKMLSLAKGTQYEGEADTAMKMAQSYMSTYGLSMSDVEVGEMLNEEIVEGQVTQNTSPENWEEYLAVAVMIICDCKVVKGWANGKRTLVFIGFKSDVGMAKILYSCLRVNNNSAARRAFPENRGARRSFRLGCSLRLCERARAEKEVAKKEPTGRYEVLVVSKEDKVQNWLDENMGDLKSANTRRTPEIDREGYEAGQKQADRMDLMNKEKVEDKQVLQLGHSKKG